MNSFQLTGARGVVEVSVLAALAVVASEVGQALALSSRHIAVVGDGADLVAFAGLALGESVVALGALLAVGTREVNLARALLAALRLAVVAICAVQVALALSAIGVSVVAIGAGVAVRRLEGRKAFAVSGLLLAMSGGVEVVALAGCPGLRIFVMFSGWIMLFGIIYLRLQTSVSFQCLPLGL